MHGVDHALAFNRVPVSAPMAPDGTWLLRLPGKRSVLIDRRATLASLLLIGLLVITSILSLCLGTVTLSPGEALAGVFGEGPAMANFMVSQLRLPRLVAGLLAGAAFAMGGCLMQSLARNRLATPGIIGIDNGATAFAVASVVGMTVSLAPPAMALIGGATATALTFGLAGGAGTRGYRFIVIGIGVGAVFGSLTQLMLARVAIDVANAAFPWTVGTLNARPAGAVTTLAIGLLIGVPAGMGLVRSLAVLRFADPVAISLGLKVGRIRFLALFLAVGLTALAVTVAGPVGLVGLMGPEIARQLSGRGVPLFGSALAGALLMILSDLVGRMLMPPLEVPVGIIVAVIGGPYLLWILLRSERMTP
ncbi:MULTISPECIES: iron chelate uptake ABC transporter family permease subunit [Pseudomonas]|uniref:FecCD family ABC transporter permease n=1 Tax=Pseudomonas TaxID=286 RepID=UPI0012389BD6|nr:MULTISPECIES: iron ABC transporter permease [Pseudomonas]QIB49986.1 iron ABC transporter permease [Pseudomonas sp. OIL-1]